MNSIKKDISKLKRQRKEDSSIYELKTTNVDRTIERTISITSVPHLFTVHEEEHVHPSLKNIYDLYLYRGRPFINVSGQSPLKPWCTLHQILSYNNSANGYFECYFLYDSQNRLFYLHLGYDADGRTLNFKKYALILEYSLSDFLKYPNRDQIYSIMCRHSYNCDFNEEPASTFYNSDGKPSQLVYQQFDINTMQSYLHRADNQPAIITTYNDTIRKSFYMFGVKYAESDYDLNREQPFHTAVYLEPEEIPTYFIPKAPPAPSYLIPVALKPYIGDTFFECCVCLGAEDRDDKVSMPCNHTAHESCITPWLEVQRTCPCCRIAF